MPFETTPSLLCTLRHVPTAPINEPDPQEGRRPLCLDCIDTQGVRLWTHRTEEAPCALCGAPTEFRGYSDR